MQTDVKQAVEVLQKGGVILYPTDTVYGIGADVYNQEAVDAVFDIKGRGANKPLSVCVADIEMMRSVAEVNPLAQRLIEKYLPGPLTLILQKKDTRLAVGVGDAESIAVRIPNSTFCLQLAKEYGQPFTTTSANTSGNTSHADFQDVLKDFGTLDMFDSVFDGGKLSGEESTIVDCRGDQCAIVRQGAVKDVVI